MKMYAKNASSVVRVEFGWLLIALLRAFDVTAKIAGWFEKLNDRLEDASMGTRAKKKLMKKAMAALRVAEFFVERALRSLATAAESADGGRQGPVYHLLFPEGLRVVVHPSGRRQLQPAEDLVTRMKNSTHPDVVSFREEWLPRIEGAVNAFASSVTAYAQAADDHKAAFQAEHALREEHYRSVDEIGGHVRAAFPGDREMQNAAFPVSRPRRATTPGGEGNDQPPAEETAVSA
ncbi:MAG: hypothetical protein HY720_25160 [Planctomycetes bacterium]|nr:hypothetical protein [Planctomycetota bacterium]